MRSQRVCVRNSMSSLCNVLTTTKKNSQLIVLRMITRAVRLHYRTMRRPSQLRSTGEQEAVLKSGCDKIRNFAQQPRQH